MQQHLLDHAPLSNELPTQERVKLRELFHHILTFLAKKKPSSVHQGPVLLLLPELSQLPTEQSVINTVVQADPNNFPHNFVYSKISQIAAEVSTEILDGL